MTPSGRVPIGQISPGTNVVSFNATERKLTCRPVTRVLAHSAATIWEIDFATARPPLATTSYHTLLTERGWVRVDRLRSGDRLVTSGQSAQAQIRQVGPTSRVEPVYNLVTAGEHTFFADEIVAHNFSFLRQMRTLLHAIVLDHSYPPTVAVPGTEAWPTPAGR